MTCPCPTSLPTPIKAAEVERWDGPQDATLFCPACGHGWVGTAAELEAAEKEWAEYEKSHDPHSRYDADFFDSETEQRKPVDPRQMSLLEKP